MPEGSKASGFSQLVVILRQNKVFLTCWEWGRTQSLGGSGGLVFQSYTNQKPAFQPQRLMNASLPQVSCCLNTNPDIVFEREWTWIMCVLVCCEQAVPGLKGRRALGQHPQRHHSRCECLSLCSQQRRQGRRGFVYYIILPITWKRGSQTHCVRARSMSFRQLHCISTASACSSCRLLSKEASEAHIREAHWLLDAYHRPHAGCTEFLTAFHSLLLRISALLSWFALAYACFWNWLLGNLAQLLQYSRSPLGHHSVLIWFLCVTYL